MTPVEHAVLETLAYFSQFGRALRPLELQELLWNCNVFPTAVYSALESLSKQRLVYIEDFIGLSEHSIQITRDRQSLLMRRRARALKIAQHLQSIRGVTSVILMNSTALQTCNEKSDIDFLILVDPGSLYLARTLAVLKLERTKLIKHHKDVAGKACLGYWLSTNDLAVQHYQTEPHTAAYWIASMVPLAGIKDYQQFIEANDWVFDYLPNLQAHKIAHLTEIPNSQFPIPKKYIDRMLFPIHRAKVMMDPTFRESSELVCTPSTLKLHSVDKRPTYGQKTQAILDLLRAR